METQKSRALKLTERAWVVPERIQAGIIVGDGSKCLVVDTGVDKAAAGKIAAVIDAEGLTPVALLVTHTHADHCGGNEALCRRYGIPAYGPPFEAAILAHPLLEPVYLYGASPPDALLKKFFLAAPTPGARPLPPGRHVLGGVPVTAVPLPGHSPGHTGYRTDDGVLFSGDAVFPAYVWEKYRLPYFFDIDAALASIEALETMAPALAACVVAHYGPVDAKELAAANREGLLGIARWAQGILAEAPATREGVTAAAFTQLGMAENEAQYYLVSSTVAALLTNLCKSGKAEARMDGGRLLYHAKQETQR